MLWALEPRTKQIPNRTSSPFEFLVAFRFTSGQSDLIEVVPPADAGVLLASVFDPAAPEDQRYPEVNREFYREPSPEMLEVFLEAAPGERAVHLRSLFDGLRGGMDSQTRSSLGRLLRGLGHGDEEIHLLLPELPE